VFGCFVDFSKAFDRVNYWKLFSQLLDDGVDRCFVQLLAFWYSSQTVCVCVSWQGCVSSKFHIGNGTRQGGVLSPYLFIRYIRPLLADVSWCGVGCNVGGLFVNILAYADDLVLLAPSWYALQDLIRTLVQLCIT